jgi:hypothetical protein
MAKGRMTSEVRDEKKAQGKELFIRGYAPLNISDLIGVGTKTINEWRKEGLWDRDKELSNIRPSEIKKLILQYVQDIKDGKKPTHKADDLSKISAAFDRMNDSRKIAVYTMESVDGFSNWLLALSAKSAGKKRENLLDLLKSIRPYFDSYVTELLEND